MRRADHITRVVAGFVDLLIVIGLTRLPDALGVLSAAGYILVRDGLFDRRSIGKKLIGLRVISLEDSGPAATYRDSIIRNVPLAMVYFLFLIPYAGWILGLAALGAEGLVSLGDRAGMRIGDLLAGTQVILAGPAPDKEKTAPAEPAGSTSPDANAHGDPQR